MRRKVIFGNFRYRECDNLALYLEKMARQAGSSKTGVWEWYLKKKNLRIWNMQ